MGLNVLFCSSEAVPFAKTGGLADVAGALPQALAKLGHNVRLALPKYRAVPSAIATSLAEPAIDVTLGARVIRVAIEESNALPDVPTYLVNCPEYFDREGLYGHPDDAERFALFCDALLQFLQRSDWRPDIIHCNDWQTALIPVFLKTRYAGHPALSSIATVLTIHNLAYQGTFDRSALPVIGLDDTLFTPELLEFYGRVNLLKGGLVYADMLNTVSRRYAEEIQTAEYGERLEGVLATRRDSLSGILNGLDYMEWNPTSDRLLPATFSPANMKGKAANKAALQQRFGLPQRKRTPLFGLVSRLAGQKGLDLLAEVLPQLLQLDVQFTFLGTGEQYYHDALSALAAKHPDKMGLVLGFDNALAHLIYAGSDLFLMPSRYEPCGLGQIISLKYGTIPVVRSTGGLADTISDFNAEHPEGNGFAFTGYSADALMEAMTRARVAYRSRAQWTGLLARAMNADFSWERSAQEYVTLYQRAAASHRKA